MYDTSCPDFRTDAAQGVSLENSMTPLKPQKRPAMVYTKILARLVVLRHEWTSTAHCE